MPRIKRGESAEFSLEPPQRERLWGACTDLDERVTIGLQMFMGLRASEACHLQTDWITEEGHLRIPFQMPCNCAECSRNRSQIWKPKTKSGARTIPIPQRLKKDLAELLKVKPYGLGISRVGLYYRTKTVLHRAKVKIKGTSSQAFPHALRATYAMSLAEGGMNAGNLCYLLGWTDLKVAEHYIKIAKLKESAIKEARAILG